MTHTRQMSEHEGDFSNAHKCGHPCRHCGGEVTYRVWESSDGAYEDYKYTCQKCGRTWWVEGADA